MQACWLGVDGGGTKVCACVVDAQQQVLACVTGPSTNQNSVGWEAAEKAFAETVAQALREAGVRTVSGACLGMSGVDREPEKVRWLALGHGVLGDDCAISVANGERAPTDHRRRARTD